MRCADRQPLWPRDARAPSPQLLESGWSRGDTEQGRPTRHAPLLCTSTACDITFDNGVRYLGAPPSVIKVPGLTADAVGGSVKGHLIVGMDVAARYGRRSCYYPGRIANVRGDGTCAIIYDDGEQESRVEPSLIKVTDAVVHGVNRDLKVGMEIMARYGGGSGYYPGRIANVHGGGTCDIEYPDGVKVAWTR